MKWTATLALALVLALGLAACGAQTGLPPMPEAFACDDCRFMGVVDGYPEARDSVFPGFQKRITGRVSPPTPR